MVVLEKRRFHNRIFIILILFSIVVLVITNVVFLFKSWSLRNTPFIHYYAYPEDDTSCHISDEDSEWFIHLNKAQETSLTPSDSRIFFHETSCKGGLSSRQACTVESAARAHPDWSIQVFFIGPIHKMFQRGVLYKTLLDFDNVNLSSINLINYSKGTPVESVFSKDILDYLKFRQGIKKYSLGDLLKYLTLYKFGGVYLELDFIVVNSFNDLAKNWAAKELSDKLGVDAFSFSSDKLGRMIAHTTMVDITTKYNPFAKDRGLGIFTRVMNKICSTKKVVEMGAETCQGFELYDPSLFFPISYDNANRHFQNSDPNLEDTYSAYTHRMWSEITASYKFPNDSRIAKLAKLYCPTVYNLYGDDFGI